MKSKTIVIVVLVLLASGAAFMGYRYYSQATATTK